MFDSWTRLACQMALLGWDAQHVIALRMMRLAKGGRLARKEIANMVDEKTRAVVEAQMAIFVAAGSSRSHQIAKDVVRGYRRRVRKNKRRLSRRP
jgi:hypothetical protein